MGPVRCRQVGSGLDDGFDFCRTLLGSLGDRVVLFLDGGTRQIQKIVIVSWRRSWKKALAEEAEASKVTT